MKKPRLLALALAGLTTIAVSACSSGGSGNPNEFQFWSFSGIGQSVAVDRYSEAHPDITVKLTEVGNAQETAQALTTALAGGKVPDLALIQADDMPKFVENAQNFVDLGELGAKDMRGDYFDWVFDQAVSVDGRIIGVPTDVGGMAMAYRADLLEEAGLPSEPDEVAKEWGSWEDFIAFGKKYTDATGKPFIDNMSTTVFFEAVNQVTEKFYTPDGELSYDTNPQVRDAFQLAIDAYDAGISADLASFSAGWSAGKANGAYAAMAAPSWMLNGIKTDAPDTEGKWRITTVPGIAGNWGGSYLAIPERAGNPDAAWDYIAEMQSPEGQLEQFRSSGSLPSTVSAYETDEVKNYTDPFFGDSKIGEVLGESLANYNSFYNGPDTNIIGTAMHSALLDTEAGNIASADAWQTALDNAKVALGG